MVVKSQLSDPDSRDFDHKWISHFQNIFIIIFSGFLQLKWTNLNPMELVRKMKDQFPDGESMEQALIQSGITSAYQEKPCIDPSDDECPDTAPNKLSGQVGSFLHLHKV